MPRDVNTIMPTELVLHGSPIHKMVRTQVIVDPSDAHHLSGKRGVPDEKLMPSKSQVMELAFATGISFEDVWEEPYRDESKRHQNIVRMKAKGTIKNSLGDTVTDVNGYTLDMRYRERDGEDGRVMNQIVSDLTTTCEDKRSGKSRWGKWWMPEDDAPWAEWEVAIRSQALKQIKQKDRFRDELAETGAKLRLVRSFCSLQTAYTRETLEKPFVIYRATVDLSRALQLGGAFGDMARQAMAAALFEQLGVPHDQGMALLPSPEDTPNVEVPHELQSLTDEAIIELEAEMLEAGFSNRAMIDRRVEDIFGASLANLTFLHASIIRELLHISGVARDKLETDDLRSCLSHLNIAARIAYIENSSIEDVMEKHWYDKILAGEEVEEEVGEKEEDVEEDEKETREEDIEKDETIVEAEFTHIEVMKNVGKRPDDTSNTDDDGSRDQAEESGGKSSSKVSEK